MKIGKLSFNPGDLFYYEPHQAFGLLVERSTNHLGLPQWKYALRSPLATNWNVVRISLRYVGEAELLEALSAGDIKYYAESGTKNENVG